MIRSLEALSVDLVDILSPDGRRNLRRKQSRDDAIFARRPDTAYKRRKDAPALSSPAKPSEPSSNPSTNHLKRTGTS
jgi:hypothetical protein